MRLSIRGLACACGLVWGGAALAVGLAHLAWPDYGGAFLSLLASIYPGFRADPDLGQVLVGALYSLVDAAVGGAIFALLYNLCAGRKRPA